jgi:hypothetical protein
LLAEFHRRLQKVLADRQRLILSATRKGHAHKLANEPSTTIQNEQKTVENSVKSIRD